MEIGPQNNLPWEQDTAESFGSEKLRPAADLKSLDEILPPEMRSKAARNKPLPPWRVKIQKILKKSPVGARVFKSALAAKPWVSARYTPRRPFGGCSPQWGNR